MSLEERLAHASDLLNAEKPRQALALLLPAAASAEAKGNYGFQSRLGNAYMGVADKLVATHSLGHIEGGVRAGITHAMLEPVIFVNRISQINSNKASQGFVKRSLESGKLTESDPIVISFRKVEAEPPYRRIAAATEWIHQAAEESEDGPQMFWHEWAQKEKAKLLQLPEYQLAAPYAA